MLGEGNKAPDFKLYDKDEKEVRLSDFLGSKVVVYFYPKDNTAGCTKQANGFAENFLEYEQRDVVLIGISKDNIKSHKNFATKYNLPFILLSDPERVAIDAFGVWQEKKMYGKTYMGTARSTFVIDENGIIEKVFEKAKTGTNAQDVLDYLDS